MIPGKVSSISYCSFLGCTSLGSVTFKGNKLEFLSSSLFEKTNIKTIKIPDSVKVIYSGAFEDCYQLESVTIPNSVETIESSAFRDCKSLKKIEFDEKKSNLSRLDFFAFSGCESLKEAVLPEKLTYLSEQCFYGCSSLSKVYMPHGLNEFGKMVFYNCDFDKLTLYVYEDSMSQTYAYEHNIKYQSRGEYDPYLGYMIGDVDADNEITSSDSLLILRYSVGLEPLTKTQKKLANVNGDSSADSADALAVLRYSVGYKDKNKIGNILE